MYERIQLLNAKNEITEMFFSLFSNILSWIVLVSNLDSADLSIRNVLHQL